MMICLDTNVLVSGLLNPFGPPGEIVRLAANGEIELSYDSRLLAEYEEVLKRPKFEFPHSLVEALIDFIKSRGFSVTAHSLPEDLPDPDDSMFIEVALAAGAEYLVTGNTRHFSAPHRHGIKVLTPDQFLKIQRAGGR